MLIAYFRRGYSIFQIILLLSWSRIQHDQIWRNFTTLATKIKSFAILRWFIKFMAKILNYFG